MIQLLNLCIFLSLTAKLSNADNFVSPGAMNLSGQTELTCCVRDQNISLCFFYAGLGTIGHQNSSDRCSVFRFVFLVILGTLTLLSLLMFIVFMCIIYKTKIQGNKQNQSANSATVEVEEEKTEIVEEELLYATVNHSAAGENSTPTVKYESGTDYATVVMH